jgi:hypothetical protein
LNRRDDNPHSRHDERASELRVCGQGLLGKKVDPKDVLPDVQLDLWAMTTMVNLQLRGYVPIGG